MNLESRTDRWEQTVEEVKKLGDDYRLIRFEAIADSRNPQLGHAQTFMNMISYAKDNEMQAILIGEDDLVLCDASREAWEAALTELPDDWDVLNGGIYHVRGRKQVTPHLSTVMDFCATHFILIRNTIYDKVLNYTKRNFGFKNIDRYIGKLTQNGDAKTYVVWPMVSSQRAGYSDLRRRKVDDNRSNKRKGLVFLTEPTEN
jgi:GR25 family glycosyltransferase involved in LPS biosynthesis